MPRTEWGWSVTPAELESWIIFDTDSLLALNKPAHLVCHPSKKGPWSSLIGACREHLGLERLHLTSRLDRETSGVVVIAKQPAMARQLNIALQERIVRKTYLAILEGHLPGPLEVNEPIGRDLRSSFVARQWVVPDGQASATHFRPVSYADGYTLAEVHPITGRRHQIRVHAAYVGYPIVGDKLYGPDETLMQRFIVDGLTPEMERQLKLDRQALHAYRIEFPAPEIQAALVAPVPPDMLNFWTAMGGAMPPALVK